MACPVVISLSAFSQYTRSTIGSRSLAIAEASSFGVPFPEQFVVPRETLARLITETSLGRTLSTILASWRTAPLAEKAVLLTHLEQAIEFAQLPEWFTTQMHLAYKQLFTAPFCRIIPTEQVAHFPADEFSEIIGDANCIESFKKAWAVVAKAQCQAADIVSLTTVCQVPLCIEEEMQAAVSGTVHTEHARTNFTPTIRVQAIWGSPNLAAEQTAADTYHVDVRTWQVVQKTAAHKKHRIERAAERRVTVSVPAQYETYPCLSDEQAIVIAQLAHSLKQKQLFHKKISWELGPVGLWITDIADEDAAIDQTRTYAKTITKVYISAGNPSKRLTQVSPEIDGIGILRSEYTYMQFGVHPEHLIRGGKQTQLSHALFKTIHDYQESVPLKPVLFRALNCTSAELGRLRYASLFETEEGNPYIGVRGGLRLLTSDHIFTTELAALTEAVTHSQAPLGYVLPFVRSPQELSALVRRIEQAGLTRFQHFSIWMQINTPENVLNFDAYPTEKLAGVSVNFTSIQALVTGADPDNIITTQQYTSDTTAFEELLQRLSTTAAKHSEKRVHAPLKLHLHLESFNQHLVACAVKFGYHGVVVKPQAVPIARAALSEAEKERLQRH